MALQRDFKEGSIVMDRTEYFKQYYSRPEVKARRKKTGKKWRENNPERMRELVNNWEREHPEKSRNWKLNNPEKIKAEKIVTNHHIPLGEFCEACPEDDVRSAVDHHHFDYAYAEQFVSCCRACHNFLNRTTSEVRTC